MSNHSAPNAKLLGDGYAGRWFPLAAFVLALLAYALTAYATGHTSAKQTAYFDHLADAFLHGRLYLAEPPGQHDLTLHDDRWYVPFPPLGAILMMPWVAAFGLEYTNTVAFSIVWGAVSVGLVAAMVEALRRRGWIELNREGRVWIVILFALGCIYWQVALDGSVWFLSHTCTVMFVALAVWAAIATRSPWPTGCALAIALWGRPNVIFTWVLLIGIAAQHLHDTRGAVDRKLLLAWVRRSAIPIVISVAGLAAYNYARFGNLLDFGYKHQNVSGEVLGDLARGQFHPYYIPRNLHVMTMGTPKWRKSELSPLLRVPVPNDRGMSIFLTTPALLYVLRVRRRRQPLARGAWLAIGLLLLPLILYYNTGWQQFGYRFSLDFIIPAIVLLALAFGRRPTWPMRLWVMFGVLVNAWGVAWWFSQ
jgi:hypothetical protein